MSPWRPQSYVAGGRNIGISEEILSNASAVGKSLLAKSPNCPPVFSLKHLAYLSRTQFGFLRKVVSRAIEDPYRTFKIRKRTQLGTPTRYRIIAVPDPELMRLQKWITRRILANIVPHSASVAYTPGQSIIDGAQPHCGCRWLIKLDVQNFFESINEISVYRAFLSLGYQPLVSFEMTRLCTRLGSPTAMRRTSRWRVLLRDWKISAYAHGRMGHLPQGAPTSPMLSNLAMLEFDAKLSDVAEKESCVYTRYADDVILSTQDPRFSRPRAQRLIGKIYSTMGCFGLSPNATKTRVCTPGSRKIVLGLLVNGAEPCLPRELKLALRQHLYYLSHNCIGPSAHAQARNFSSIGGMKNYIRGLISYAHQVEPSYAATCKTQFDNIKWPI